MYYPCTCMYTHIHSLPIICTAWQKSSGGNIFVFFSDLLMTTKLLKDSLALSTTKIPQDFFSEI